MGLRERVVPDASPERGNVMLAAAMMLAVLVVLVALGLTLAPTGSDGITDESADDTEFDVVGSGLQQAVFVESNDTLDPDYDPEFRPPDSNGPAPIDNGTIAELLASEPFTDEQVVQIQSLLTSLGYRSMGGDIAALEPVASATETGVLVRLGNLEPRDLGDAGEPFVENATAVQDVELVFERTTLPETPENATTAHVGDWTLAAHQNRSTDRVHYQLGSYDPGAEWQTTGAEENLQVNVHEETVNGAPVAGGLEFDPGDAPVDVWVVDTNRSSGGAASTYGGLNLVAVGADEDDLNTDTLSAETDWQEVVTRPVFNTTYLDATTTLDTRLAVDARYTHFEYAHNGSESFLMDVSLAVETEDRSGLDGQLPAGALWLPDYSMESVNYTIDVIGTYSNGTRIDLSGPADISIHNRTASGPEPCTDGQGCVELYDDSGGTLPYNYLAIPHTLTDVQIQAEVAGIGGVTDTLRRNLSIVDPYTDTELSVAADAIVVNNSLGGLVMELEPRKRGLANRRIPGQNISALYSQPARHAANGLAGPLDISTSGSKRQVADALTELRTLDAAERTSFLSKPPGQQAAMLGASAAGPVFDLLQFFDADTTCGACRNFTAGDAVKGPPQWAKSTNFGPQSQFGLVYQGSPDIDVELSQQLHRRYENRTQNAAYFGNGISEAKLLEFGTNTDTLADPGLAAKFVETAGWADTPARNRTAHLVLGYIEKFNEYANLYYNTALYDLSSTELRSVAGYVRADHISDDVESIPAQFDKKAQKFLSTLKSGTPVLDGRNYHNQSSAGQHIYWWLAGVDDAQVRDNLRNLVKFGGTDQPAVARSSDLLFDIADYALLDQQALDQGDVELATLDALWGTWNVAMDGTYTGYDFATYSATDPVTVTDLASKIENITVALDTQSLDPITKDEGCSVACDVIDPPTLYSDEVLEVDDTADITTTVTYRTGEKKTNPPYIDYSLAGPSFTAGPCAHDWVCANYTGLTTPEGFATVNDPQHTLTTKRATGVVQASTDGDSSSPDGSPNSSTIESGPLVLTASVDGTQLSDTATTSVVNIEVSGYLSPDDTVELYADPADAPGSWDGQRWPTDIGVSYRIEHTPDPAVTAVPYTAAYREDWMATRAEQVRDDRYINASTYGKGWNPNSSTNVSYFTGDPSLPGWSSDEGGLSYTGPTDPDGPEEGFVELWYNESDALDVADTYAIDEMVNASTKYLVEADANGCSNCGGGPPDLTGSLSAMGSPDKDPILDPIDQAKTTLQTPVSKYNTTVDPARSRGHYLDMFPGQDPFVEFINITATENQTTRYYLWSNVGAILEGDLSSLINGTVGWRNQTGCSAIGGCTDRPNGIVDHLDGPGDVQWESKATNVDSNSSLTVSVAQDPENNAGRHDHDLEFYVENNGDPRPDTITGVVTFRLEKDDWGMQDWVDVGFNVETKDDPGGVP